MPVPSTIRAGATVQWIQPATVDLSGNPATSASWALTVYLRTNTATKGATLTGTARNDGGWDLTISATTSAGFDVGTWYWETRATAGAVVLEVGSGTLQVLPSLSYNGAPGAFDGRSQAEQDLQAVQAAIRALISKGAKMYQIGTRRFEAADLAELIRRESQLKAIVARERAAEKVAAGLGDPRAVYVRF